MVGTGAQGRQERVVVWVGPSGLVEAPETMGGEEAEATRQRPVVRAAPGRNGPPGALEAAAVVPEKMETLEGPEACMGAVAAPERPAARAAAASS